MNEEEEIEWQRVNHIPDDDYDEDDELDARIEEAERKRRNHVFRGDFFSTT